MCCRLRRKQLAAAAAMNATTLDSITSTSKVTASPVAPGGDAKGATVQLMEHGMVSVVLGRSIFNRRWRQNLWSSSEAASFFVGSSSIGFGGGSIFICHRRQRLRSLSDAASSFVLGSSGRIRRQRQRHMFSEGVASSFVVGGKCFGCWQR